jgi:hypothetical protein
VDSNNLCYIYSEVTDSRKELGSGYILTAQDGISEVIDCAKPLPGKAAKNQCDTSIMDGKNART